MGAGKIIMTREILLRFMLDILLKHKFVAPDFHSQEVILAGSPSLCPISDFFLDVLGKSHLTDVCGESAILYFCSLVFPFMYSVNNSG